ncbi:RNA polymerase sigma factor, sigma-70 family [Gemmatirosa kalamazoonensis]|uniref:RNA polymerase sigma factor n=1 Tax=Gemmatirosa kalamazoonensis TaxID=861299 RepID=W0RCU6_9BACT|nr:RNA polymerase sigma factor [Gemmatirosa kalamazoonensis]AHG88944.1 RNA polymerase sigma factor, sigma-70 family [Gemmatirosa kalamazoonensis]
MDTADIRCALERYHAACFAWALACCGRDRAEAEDVLQATYLKILDGRARFDGRSHPKTWLFGVVRRTAAEERRRRLLWLRVRHPALVESAAPDPSDADADARARAELLAALGALAPRQREVLHLVFYEELTIEEAAAVMRVSVGTARTHYERGKARLRARLGSAR